MSDKPLKTPEPRSGNNTISIDIINSISVGAAKYSGEVVKKYITNKMSGNATVKVTSKNKKFYSRAAEFERMCRIHIKGDLKFIYG